MANQVADDALRQKIAQWTRAALGELVDNGTQSQAAVTLAAPIVMRYRRRRGAGQRHGGTQVRKLAPIHPANTAARLALRVHAGCKEKE
jgi:hypothetical protein